MGEGAVFANRDDDQDDPLPCARPGDERRETQCLHLAGMMQFLRESGQSGGRVPVRELGKLFHNLAWRRRRRVLCMPSPSATWHSLRKAPTT